jgi:hypothetical protein
VRERERCGRFVCAREWHIHVYKKKYTWVIADRAAEASSNAEMANIAAKMLVGK